MATHAFTQKLEAKSYNCITYFDNKLNWIFRLKSVWCNSGWNDFNIQVDCIL